MAVEVTVLMAAFNGGPFFSSQVDSLLSQDYDAWRLIIGDDGSDDGTFGKACRYQQNFPERIAVIRHEDGERGATRNFSRLLALVDTPYFMLCDQDDVWDDSKISQLVGAISSAEQEYGKRMPILVHSGLTVCGPDLQAVAKDFHDYQALRPRNATVLKRLVVENPVVGCSLIGNAALLEAALPISYDAVMHDWWLALVACCFGRVLYHDVALTMYRQHEKNVVGSSRYDWKYVLRSGIELLYGRSSVGRRLYLSQVQSKSFAERFGSSLSTNQLATLDAYSTLSEQPFLLRFFRKIHHQFYLTGFWRNIGYLLFC
jgi:glycosyltransferase involved in cell wall biosynthesis